VGCYVFVCVDRKYETGMLTILFFFFLHIDLQELALYLARRGVHIEVQCNNRELSHPAPLFSLHQRHLGLVVLSSLLLSLE
jgi:hypothetical protein